MRAIVRSLCKRKGMVASSTLYLRHLGASPGVLGDEKSIFSKCFDGRDAGGLVAVELDGEHMHGLGQERNEGGKNGDVNLYFFRAD